MSQIDLENRQFQMTRSKLPHTSIELVHELLVTPMRSFKFVSLTMEFHALTIAEVLLNHETLMKMLTDGQIIWEIIEVKEKMIL